MLPNGLILTLDMALAGLSEQTQREYPVSQTQYAWCVLGMFREDVVFIPGLARALPSPSLSHHWPLAKWRFLWLYKKAVRHARRGHTVQSAVNLGRAMHVLIDMACPVHAKPAVHYLRDPYERYVDAHAQELAAMALPALEAPDGKLTLSGLITLIAHAARREAADLTQSPWGRALKALGWRKALCHEHIAPQARRLIPLVAACLCAVIEKFVADTADGVTTRMLAS